jgi:hypothetical protein
MSNNRMIPEDFNNNNNNNNLNVRMVPAYFNNLPVPGGYAEVQGRGMNTGLTSRFLDNGGSDNLINLISRHAHVNPAQIRLYIVRENRAEYTMSQMPNQRRGGRRKTRKTKVKKSRRSRH